MLLCSDGGLSAVRVLRIKHCCQSCPDLTLVLGDADVVFLIDSLELGVETADHHVLEAV